MAINQRLQKLHHKLIEKELDSILISQPDNIRYLSGFDGSTATLLISQDSSVLVTDFRYIGQAELQAPDFEVVQIKGEFRERVLLELASGIGAKNLGFEANSLCFNDYRRLGEEADNLKLQLIHTESLVESIRAVKDQEEISCIIKAVELAEAALEYMAGGIHPGMKEREVAWEIEKFLREKGSESMPFDVIVASGPNAALPHAKSTERLLSQGEPIVIDLGARVAGYTSDLTRTFFLDSPDATFNNIYGLVLDAQLAAIDHLEVGMVGEQVDGIARKIIEQGGYKDAFGHGLGHGVGLATHEMPRLGPNSKDVLLENMVFTVEPGIYLSGRGGVRIEDIVMIEGGRAKKLSNLRN